MTFREFLHNWLGRGVSLDYDAAWRAYDIPAVVRPRHVSKALKALKLAYAGEHAIPQFMALYGLGDRAEAEALLGQWWVWSQVDAGRPVQGLKRRGRLPT